uniref:CC domain-containing protein n=1 Tax=Rhabditophanes sp. KR3021 TaxID=114890 RepID=A0AC35TXL8_9BILA
MKFLIILIFLNYISSIDTVGFGEDGSNNVCESGLVCNTRTYKRCTLPCTIHHQCTVPGGAIQADCAGTDMTLSQAELGSCPATSPGVNPYNNHCLPATVTPPILPIRVVVVN